MAHHLQTVAQQLHRDMTRAFYDSGLAYSKNEAGEWVRKSDLDAQPLKTGRAK